MFKVCWISSTGAFSVCGNNVDANLCLPLSWYSTLTRQGCNGCHPELVSGSKLLANPTSPLPCLGFAPRWRGAGRVSLRSTVTDYSLFTIHNSLPFDANLCLPPPSIPPLKGEGSVRKLLLFSKAGFSKIFISFWISSTGAFSVCGKKYWCKHHVCPLTEVNLTGDGKSIIVRSTVKDYSQFTIHYSLILM